MRGSCLCGGVVFELECFVQNTTHCHCSMCRKFHGAAFATYGVVPREKFHWLSGESLLRHYQAKNNTVRTFCGHCGSSLMYQTEPGSAYLDIALGTLDESVTVAPEAHIYTASKAEWFTITDVLPQFDEGHELQ